jgi:hypothetical protein
MTNFLSESFLKIVKEQILECAENNHDIPLTLLESYHRQLVRLGYYEHSSDGILVPRFKTYRQTECVEIYRQKREACNF